jgi:hypothetical protein
VAVGGTTGQVLQKLSGVNYDTGWLTLPADYITSVSAPLDVTAGNLSVDLSPYAPINAPTFTGVVTIPSGADIGTGAIIGATAIIGAGAIITSPTLGGVPLTPTAGTSDNSFQVASTAFVKNQGYLTTALAATTYQTLAGMSSYLTTSAAASTYYLQTNPSGFQTAANVTTALSPYLLSATAASTYAVIAAGQPVAGSTGQVLTKQSGTNYDSIWTTIIPGDRYLTTSTTSNTVSNGNKTFTIGTGLSYTPTQNITISYDVSNHMHGEVLTYNSGTGVLTVDVNHHTGSGTYAAWVVNVGGVTPATSVAWGAITGTLSSQTDLQSALDLKANLSSPTFTGTPTLPTGTIGVTQTAADSTTALATTAFVTTADNLKANLASPTFTGTPTLPTGTIGVTQTAGNNTTALATTAFVTAAVPAFASSTQSRAATSTTVAQSPGSDMWQMMNPGFIPILRNTLSYAATGTMGSAAIGNYTSRMTMGTVGAASASFRTFGSSQIDQAWICVSKGYRSYIDFSRVTWCSGRFYTDDTWTDPQVSAGFYFGKAANSANGNLARKGFGWRINGNATAGSRTALLQVHNGTTLTDVATSFALVSQQYFDWDVVSLGNGTVTLYINGTQVATTALGPTGDTSYSGSTPVIWNEEFVSTGTTAAYNATFSRGLLYIAP